MADAKPIRLFSSPFRSRIFATRAYRERAPGVVSVTGRKDDVTDECVGLVASDPVLLARANEMAAALKKEESGG